MEKYLIILNIFVLFALIVVVFLILKNNREKKEREIRENESFKNESDKFEELKRTVSERLENVSTSTHTTLCKYGALAKTFVIVRRCPGSRLDEIAIQTPDEEETRFQNHRNIRNTRNNKIKGIIEV